MFGHKHLLCGTDLLQTILIVYCVIVQMTNRICQMYFKRSVQEVEWTEVWLLLLEVCWDKLPKIPHTIKPSSISQVFLFHDKLKTTHT